MAHQQSEDGTMRKFLIGAAAIAALAAAPTAVMAQASTTAGVAIGAGTGFAVGGPPGAVIGGIIGGSVGAAHEPHRVYVEPRADARVYVNPPRERVCWETRRGDLVCDYR
jgi:hypothetical protein